MEVEDGEDGASAGRGEGGADAPADHARPSQDSQDAAAPARPASASAITAMVLALGDTAWAEQRGDQARGGAAGCGSTDEAGGTGSEGQQGSGTHLAGQVAVAGDGTLVNIGKARCRSSMIINWCAVLRVQRTLVSTSFFALRLF